jgi:hypothetical protein
MATFQIGDSARLIGSKSAWLDFCGREVTIVSGLIDACSLGRAYRGYEIVVKGCIGSGWRYVAEPHELQPIRSERNRIVAWEAVPGGKPNIAEPCLRMAHELVTREAA